MSAPDNPQAFPAAFTVGPNDDLYPPVPGMTLRDWFAGQALAGITSKGLPAPFQSAENAAIACFELADAMLAERAKGETR